MNSASFIRRAILMVLAILFVAGLSYGQNYKNNGSLTNTNTLNVTNFQNYRTVGGYLNNSGTVHATGTFTNSSGGLNGAVSNQISATSGTINVDGDFTNSTGFVWNSTTNSLILVGGNLTNTTAANFSTDTGRVEYKNASTAQTILATVKSSTYGGLNISGGGGGTAAKTLGGSVTVAGVVNIAASSNLVVGAGNSLIVEAYPNAFSTGAGSVVDGSAATATVNYAAPGTNAQNIASGTYGNLTVSNGTGTRTAQGAVTVKTAVTNNASTILDFSTFALDASTATSIVNTNATIQTAGSVTFNGTPTIAGTFIYQASTGTQNLGAATYNNLTVQSGSVAAGQKDFPSGTVTVTGTYSAGGANRVYGTGTFAYAGVGASVAQTVVGGESYNNLTITGATDTTFTVAGHKKANGSLTIAGALTIAANNVLDMQTNAISSLGSGSNLGKIMWAAGNKAVAGAGVTEFYAENTATVDPSVSYGVILFTGSGTKTIGGTVTTGPGSTLGNGLVIASTGNLTLSGTGILTVNGDLQNDGALTNGGSITVQ